MGQSASPTGSNQGSVSSSNERTGGAVDRSQQAALPLQPFPLTMSCSSPRGDSRHSQARRVRSLQCVLAFAPGPGKDSEGGVQVEAPAGENHLHWLCVAAAEAGSGPCEADLFTKQILYIKWTEQQTN